MVKSKTFRADPPSALSPLERRDLFRLFGLAFQASREGFERDLKEKELVLRVFHDRRVVAFSSLLCYRPEPAVSVYYSGDTFASPEARLGHGLPRLWAEVVFSRLQSEAAYWLLLCSGFRTYRILPTFFRAYVPGPTERGSLADLKESWARDLFGERYHQGVVKPRWATPLREPEPPARLLGRPDVALFRRLNPGYAEGNELVCLAPLCSQNLTRLGLRLLKAAKSSEKLALEEGEVIL